MFLLSGPAMRIIIKVSQNCVPNDLGIKPLYDFIVLFAAGSLT